MTAAAVPGGVDNPGLAVQPHANTHKQHILPTLVETHDTKIDLSSLSYRIFNDNLLTEITQIHVYTTTELSQHHHYPHTRRHHFNSVFRLISFFYRKQFGSRPESPSHKPQLLNILKSLSNKKLAQPTTSAASRDTCIVTSLSAQQHALNVILR